MNIDEQIALIKRGTTKVIDESALRKKLSSGVPLRIKLGVDPTAKDVTLGWAVLLRKLRDFQKLGHIAHLVVGDFTAQIGDPSGKSKTRKQLSVEEVRANTKAVCEQFGKIIDMDRALVCYNSHWLTCMSFTEAIQLCSQITVARIMERDDFAQRFENHEPISLHELIYPLCQGRDSVVLEADVELGGNDQMFNTLVGRHLQEQAGQAPQAVVLSKLLIGLDGHDKMSQSLGNYISVMDDPNTMFGRTMSIPDELIPNWCELCTDLSLDALNAMSDNPKDVKLRIAHEIVESYHSKSVADEAEAWFVHTFSRRAMAAEAPEAIVPAHLGDEMSLAKLIVTIDLCRTTSDARAIIEKGGVEIDELKITNPMVYVNRADLIGKMLKVGKHRFRRLVDSPVQV